jgi:hypothetical protein
MSHIPGTETEEEKLLQLKELREQSRQVLQQLLELERQIAALELDSRVPFTPMSLAEPR